jgi:TonB family protein
MVIRLSPESCGVDRISAGQARSHQQAQAVAHEDHGRCRGSSRLLQPTETTKAPETPQQVLPLPQPHDVPAYPMKRLHDDGTKHARPADVPVLPPPAEGRRGPVGSALGKPGEQAETIDALALIRRRLEAMVPFCYPSEANRRGLKGTALLRFQLDSLGYPFVMQLVTSSGHAVLDDQLETLLHLAEPYPMVEGWVVVPVTFPAPAAK